jgi:hypothetical protein
MLHRGHEDTIPHNQLGALCTVANRAGEWTSATQLDLRFARERVSRTARGRRANPSAIGADLYPRLTSAANAKVPRVGPQSIGLFRPTPASSSLPRLLPQLTAYDGLCRLPAATVGSRADLMDEAVSARR